MTGDFDLKLLSIATSAIKAAAVTAVLCFATTANAGQFGVRVVDEAGMPVAGASVCFGLPGNYGQFGTVFTDTDGQAMTEVPNIPFVVTVSKTRFSGVRINEPARGFNLVKQVTLTDGVPGPRCKAGSTLTDASQSSIRISDVDVVANTQVTVLTPIATGAPTEYRVGGSESLDSLQWRKLNDSIRLPRSLASLGEVYLQLRRYEGTGGSWLEARSDAVMVYLPASSPRL